MYSWINTFHNTKAKSKLNEKDLIEIDHLYYLGKINSTDAKYRAKRKLEKTLCPAKSCKCGGFNKTKN